MTHLTRGAEPPLPPHIQALRIPVLHGSLDARLCLPDPTPAAAILICHGIADRLRYWREVQALLRDHGLATLIFSYSGYGSSTGAITHANLRRDTQAAYATLLPALPAHTPIYLLGFSLGTGIATDAVPHLTPAPAGLILCQSFRSLRSAAEEITGSTLLARLLPNVWDTLTYLPALTLPILILHSDSDRLFPLTHADDLHRAALTRRGPLTHRATPTGFAHNGAFVQPSLAYWQPVLDFLHML